MSPADDLTDRIDGVLPQTQCGQCGYDGCRPYARALARSETELNRCPPGGEEGIRALANILDRPAKPLDPACGEHHEPPLVAVIDESVCIGCVRCIDACPVDAIAGAAKRMHTVIEDECTGCELCLPVCPVDCIELTPATARAAESHPQRRARAQHARRRYDTRNQRLEAHLKAKTKRQQKATAGAGQSEEQSTIAAAIARAGRSKPPQRGNAVNKAIERARAQRRAAEGNSREQG